MKTIPPTHIDSTALSMAAPWIHEDAAAAMPAATRGAAIALLADALGGGASANAPLINKLFGASHGSLHCHRRRREIEVSVLRQYRCAAAMAGGRPPPAEGPPRVLALL